MPKISDPLAYDLWHTDIVLSFLSLPCDTSYLIFHDLPIDIWSFWIVTRNKKSQQDLVWIKGKNGHM